MAEIGNSIEFWTGQPQAARRKSLCQIIVAGQDVTSKFDPHLLSIEVVDKRTEVSTCAIELDDRDGRLNVPSDFAPIIVHLGWQGESFYNVFAGRVWDVESGFGRKFGGRRMWIDAVGVAPLGLGKTPMQKHWGEGAPPGQKTGTMVPLSQVLQDAANAAGYTIDIGPSFANVARDYWAMQTESFHHFGNRLAAELGAAFKVEGTRASFQDLSTTSGEITAKWGTNLIEWRIKPYAARPIWQDTKTDYFDLAESKWKQVTGAAGGDGPFGESKSTTQLPAPAPNAAVGDQINGGAKNQGASARGQGWVIINGEPQARAGMRLNISGARPGVDGGYSIDEAHHHYYRAGGYTTLCKVLWPELATKF